MGTNRSAKNPGVAIMLESEILFGSPRARLAQSAMPEKEANFYTFLGGLQESLGDDRRDTYLLAKPPLFNRKAASLFLTAATKSLRSLTVGSPEEQDSYRRLSHHYDRRVHGWAARVRELSNEGPVVYIANSSRAPKAVLDAADILSRPGKPTHDLEKEPLFGHGIMVVIAAGEGSKDHADDVAIEATHKNFRDRAHYPLASDGSPLQGTMSHFCVEGAGLNMKVLPLSELSYETGGAIGQLLIGTHKGHAVDNIK